MSNKKQEFKLKRDQYMSARGGTSSFLDIYCAQCRQWLLLYQKDGPGNLFRLYLDRIHSSKDLSGFSDGVIKAERNGISCPHCKSSIGIYMIYKPESRPAFRLIPGSIVKKKGSGKLSAPTTIK